MKDMLPLTPSTSQKIKTKKDYINQDTILKQSPYLGLLNFLELANKNTKSIKSKLKYIPLK